MRKKHLIEFIYDLPLNHDQRNELFDKIAEDKDTAMYRGIGIAIGLFSLLILCGKIFFNL